MSQEFDWFIAAVDKFCLINCKLKKQTIRGVIGIDFSHILTSRVQVNLRDTARWPHVVGGALSFSLEGDVVKCCIIAKTATVAAVLELCTIASFLHGVWG